MRAIWPGIGNKAQMRGRMYRVNVVPILFNILGKFNRTYGQNQQLCIGRNLGSPESPDSSLSLSY